MSVCPLCQNNPGAQYLHRQIGLRVFHRAQRDPEEIHWCNSITVLPRWKCGEEWGGGKNRRPRRFVTAVCLLNLTKPGRLTHFHIISGLINCGAHVAVVGVSHVALFKFAHAVDWRLNLTKQFAYATCINTATAINDNSWLPITCMATNHPY